MELEKNNRMRVKHPDTVTIDQKNLTKVARWMDQIESQTNGVKVTRKDIVNWLICAHAESLSTKELSAISRLFYDEERMLLQILKNVRRAKANGEQVSLEDLKHAISGPKILKGRTTRRTKGVQITEKDGEQLTQDKISSQESKMGN